MSISPFESMQQLKANWTLVVMYLGKFTTLKRSSDNSIVLISIPKKYVLQGNHAFHVFVIIPPHSDAEMDKNRKKYLI